VIKRFAAEELLDVDTWAEAHEFAESKQQLMRGMRVPMLSHRWNRKDSGGLSRGTRRKMYGGSAALPQNQTRLGTRNDRELIAPFIRVYVSNFPRGARRLYAAALFHRPR